MNSAGKVVGAPVPLLEPEPPFPNEKGMGEFKEVEISTERGETTAIVLSKAADAGWFT